MKHTPLKRIPKFRTEDEERDFWATKGRDSTQYLDWSKARLARFPNLKPSTRSISLRLPPSLLERIKLEANKLNVPYQALIKIWLAEKVGVGIPAAVPFVGSDRRPGDVARHSKRLLREHSRGK